MSGVFAMMRLSLRVVTAIIFLAGCSAPAPDVLDGGSDALDAGAGDTADVDGCVDAVTCVDTTPDPSCDATWVAVVTGRVVDDDGAPIEGARSQLCARLSPDDRLVCLDPPRSRADGTFTIVLGPTVRCLRAATLRYVLPAGGMATSYCGLDLGLASDGIVGLPEDAVMFRVDAAIGLPPLGDESVSREVDLGPVVLDLAPSTLGLDAPYEALGARAVDPGRSCLASMRAMEGTIALAPEARVHPGAPIRLRAAGLAPGERVELHLLGGLATELADGTSVDEGELALMGAGTVGSDGLVAFPAPVTLTYLSWLGWRRAP